MILASFKVGIQQVGFFWPQRKGRPLCPLKQRAKLLCCYKTPGNQLEEGGLHPEAACPALQAREGKGGARAPQPPWVLRNSATRNWASSLIRCSMDRFPIPKFFRVPMANLRSCLQRSPVPYTTPGDGGGRWDNIPETRSSLACPQSSSFPGSPPAPSHQSSFQPRESETRISLF